MSEDKNPFIGKGATLLKQFNGYYRLGGIKFVNIEHEKYYKVDGETEKLYITYPVDDKKYTYVTQGDITFEKDKNVTLLKGNDVELEFGRLSHELIFSYTPPNKNKTDENKDEDAHNEDIFAITYVIGKIGGKSVSGFNYLNYIPLESFIATYDFSINVNTHSPANCPTMTIKKNEFLFKYPKDSTKKQIQEFKYNPTMFTLSFTDVLMFLGSVASGLDAWAIVDKDAYFLESIASLVSFPAVSNLPETARFFLSRFSGYYALENANSFFSVYPTVKYDQKNPNGWYSLQLTYSTDGKNITSIEEITSVSVGVGNVATIKWVDTNIKKQVVLKRKEKFDVNDCILTTISGSLGNGINTINLTPLKYFTGLYRYASNKDIKLELQIKPDETVYLAVDGKIFSRVYDFTYAGTMYLLVVTVGSTSYTFMLGVHYSGLCAYCISPNCFLYTIQPVT